MMKVIWIPSETYRCFLSQEAQVISLISTNLSEEAEGETFDDCLTVAKDPNGRFCDFELLLSQAQEAFGIPDCGTPENREDPLETFFPANRIVYYVERLRSRFFLQLDHRVPEVWWAMGESNLLLGTQQSGLLSSLVFEGVSPDENGSLEHEWLSSLEKMHKTPKT